MIAHMTNPMINSFNIKVAKYEAIHLLASKGVYPEITTRIL